MLKGDNQEQNSIMDLLTSFHVHALASLTITNKILSLYFSTLSSIQTNKEYNLMCISLFQYYFMK